MFLFNMNAMNLIQYNVSIWIQFIKPKTKSTKKQNIFRSILIQLPTIKCEFVKISDFFFHSKGSETYWRLRWNFIILLSACESVSNNNANSKKLKICGSVLSFIHWCNIVGTKPCTYILKTMKISIMSFWLISTVVWFEFIVTFSWFFFFSQSIHLCFQFLKRKSKGCKQLWIEIRAELFFFFF